MEGDARRNDGTEAGALDDDVRVGLAAHLGHHRPDELALAVAVGPDHEMRRRARLAHEVLLDAALVGVLRAVEGESAQHRVEEGLAIEREETHLVDEGLDRCVEELDRLAAVPLAVGVVKVVGREVAGDGRDGEVGMRRARAHAVREAVVLDPFRACSVSLRARDSCQLSSRRRAGERGGGGGSAPC